MKARNLKNKNNSKKAHEELIDPTHHYINKIGLEPVLSFEDEIILSKRIKNGDRIAHKKMVKCNLRLVLKIAHQYKSRGIPLLDLISEGNLGLLHAIEKYDHDRGFRFSTYATWWIRQNIEHAIMIQTRNIKLPIHIIKKLSRYLRTKQQLIHELGKTNVSTETIAEKLEVESLQVINIMNHTFDTKSLDIKFSTENNTTLKETVADDQIENPIDLLCEESLHKHINTWLEELDEQTQTIIIYRYGLRGEERFTLDEISSQLNIAREQVRQIQLRAIKKLQVKLKHMGLT
jgi:RNA polymerase nonessential primary-like sigma factor